jgi:hypothetical protein
MTTRWTPETADRDSVTHLYVKPEPEPGVVPVRPTVRSYEVEDRFALPILAARGTPRPAAGSQANLAFVPAAGSQVNLAFVPAQHTEPVRRQPASNLLGLAFAGVCILLGIAIGAVFALSSRSPAAVVAPVVRAKPVAAPRPVVTPIIVPSAH